LYTYRYTTVLPETGVHRQERREVDGRVHTHTQNRAFHSTPQRDKIPSLASATSSLPYPIPYPSSIPHPVSHPCPARDSSCFCLCRGGRAKKVGWRLSFFAPFAAVPTTHWACVYLLHSTTTLRELHTVFYGGVLEVDDEYGGVVCFEMCAGRCRTVCRSGKNKGLPACTGM
jgi:hypothetical protein